MARELLFALLALCGAALSLPLTSWIPSSAARFDSYARLERRRWRELWTPFILPAVVVAVLCGWASQEPENAEGAAPGYWLLAGPFFLVCLRAVVRRILANRAGGEHAAATVGLLRPHVLVARSLGARLDADALSAVLAHERAHAAHRDPLRILLARLATDLQWPSRGASRRLAEWLDALELARDEEARVRGTDGADLAAALVEAARHERGAAGAAQATLATPGQTLRRRVHAALRPLLPSAGAPRRSFKLSVGLGVLLSAAFVVGSERGETAVRWVLGL